MWFGESWVNWNWMAAGHYIFAPCGYNNTNICNARSVSKQTESETQAVARWGGWREWSV